VPFELDPELLRGKVALITGASRGLGAGLARRFAHHGLQLALCARTEPTPPPGARAMTGAVDVTDAEALDRFAEAAARMLGPIDLWVNNAGVVQPIGPLRTLDPSAISQAFDINVGGVVNGTRCFAQRARTWVPDRRVLVNISSGAATSIYEGWSIYGAAKAAVDHLTEIVAAEEPELLCYAVAPGVVDTDMQKILRKQKLKNFPAVERFKYLHANHAWNSPDWVADHLLGILAGSLAPERVVYRVPDEPQS
jgi:NAD(P)-dependent dehydrogenase (short-subunit alcohol dehydrogenase family)